MPIEIKSGKTIARETFTGLEKWSALAGKAVIEPTLIYGGSESYRHKGIRVLGWRKCGELLYGLR